MVNQKFAGIACLKPSSKKTVDCSSSVSLSKFGMVPNRLQYWCTRSRCCCRYTWAFCETNHAQPHATFKCPRWDDADASCSSANGILKSAFWHMLHWGSQPHNFDAPSQNWIRDCPLLWTFWGFFKSLSWNICQTGPPPSWLQLGKFKVARRWIWIKKCRIKFQLYANLNTPQKTFAQKTASLVKTGHSRDIHRSLRIGINL